MFIDNKKNQFLLYKFKLKMSNSCNNCNIQNSNPSINNNSGFSINKINPPRKRYNPGSADYGHLDVKTASVIKKILNVPQQSSFGSDSGGSNSSSSRQAADAKTLQAISKVVNVDTNIIDIDVADNMRNLANQRLRQMASDNVDTSNKAVINLGRVINKIDQEVVKVDEKDDKKKKNTYRNS